MSGSGQADNVVLVSDIDGTLTGDSASLRELLRWLTRRHIKLICATGRHHASARSVLARNGIPAPVALITDVGCEVRVGESDPDDDWNRHVTNRWNRAALAARLQAVPGLKAQKLPSGCIRLGYLVTGDEKTAETAGRIRRLVGSDARVVVSGDCIDVIPPRAGKGPAARYALARLGLGLESAVAAGDSGNDVDMLEQLPTGIVVSNAPSDLVADVPSSVYLAGRRHAAGVLEGLQALFAQGFPSTTAVGSSS